jgi:head-tail adaptor
MNPGKMRTLILIEHEVAPADDVLGLPAAWNPYAKAWCQKKTQPGNEEQNSQQQRAKSRVEFGTHWTPILAGITAKMRLVDPDGKILAIVSVENVDGLNEELRMVCETTDQGS